MLLDFIKETEYVFERNIVFQIDYYMKEKVNTLIDFDGSDLDCEYNCNINGPKESILEPQIVCGQKNYS